MAKSPDAAPSIFQAPSADQITVTLNEFCARLSETVVRPELIGAFAHTERAAGNARDTAEAFKARFDEFINKPV